MKYLKLFEDFDDFEDDEDEEIEPHSTEIENAIKSFKNKLRRSKIEYGTFGLGHQQGSDIHTMQPGKNTLYKTIIDIDSFRIGHRGFVCHFYDVCYLDYDFDEYIPDLDTFNNIISEKCYIFALTTDGVRYTNDSLRFEDQDTVDLFVAVMCEHTPSALLLRRIVSNTNKRYLIK